MPNFTFGPDQPDDLRLTRPYFVVPFPTEPPQPGAPDPLKDFPERIRKWADQSAKEPTSVLLRLADVPHPGGLAAKLTARNDPVSAHIKRQLPADTQRLLHLAAAGYVIPSLPSILLDEMNALLRGECLYDPRYFHAGRQPALTPQLIDACNQARANKVKGPPVLRLNRRLMEEAYPDDVLPSPPKGPVTDVVVLSHGWHRNFFSAVEAYDKLMNGLAVLMHRERLKRPEPYHPLFVTLHWHSDPGENDWEDKQGRRNLTSFLENVEKAFERPSDAAERHNKAEDRFTSVFEDIFQLFSRMSAPGTNALSDSDMMKQGVALAAKLRNFYLRDAASAELADKVSAVWACYDTAQPKGVLLDQSDLPAEFITFGRAAYNLWQFFFKAVGLGVLFSVLLGLLGHADLIWRLLGCVSQAIRVVVGWVWAIPYVPPVMQWADANVLQPILQNRCVAGVAAWAVAYPWASIPLGLILASLLILGTEALRYNPQGTNRPGSVLSVLYLAAWACLEAVPALLLVCYLLFTYFIGRLFSGAWLFDERFGRRNAPLTRGPKTIPWKWLFPAHDLAWVARGPVWLLRKCLSKDSMAAAFVDGLDGQLAFWDMQIRGVETGARAAEFLAPLFCDLKLTDVRIHFVGHSFGGLVVANAVRHLALAKDLNDCLVNVQPAVEGKPAGVEYKGKIHTLCLLEAAMASGWFKDEAKLLALLNGSLVSIYSRYDTANGFYYPAGNHGRLSAGYVGLYRAGANQDPYTLPDKNKKEDAGRFASLTEPPDLNKDLSARNVPRQGCWILNLDASRFIYEGPYLAGGGHMDIYKPDVVHLIWAVTRLK